MDAQQEIFEAVLPRLKSLAMRILRDEEAVDEVLDAVWAEWQTAPRLGNETSYAMLVASSIQCSLLRSRTEGALGRVFASEWTLEPTRSVPLITAEQSNDRADDISVSLVLLLEGLPPSDRTVLLLRKVFRLEYADIAAQVGLPESECVAIVDNATSRLFSLIQRGRAQ